MEQPTDTTWLNITSTYQLACEYQAQGWYNIHEFLLHAEARPHEVSLEMELTTWYGQQFTVSTVDPFRYFLRLQKSLAQGEMVHARVGAIDRALGEVMAERTRPAKKYFN